MHRLILENGEDLGEILDAYYCLGDWGITTTEGEFALLPTGGNFLVFGDKGEMLGIAKEINFEGVER